VPTDDDTLIPLAQVALRLGITNAVAYSRVRQGKLHATPIKNRLMVRGRALPRRGDEPPPAWQTARRSPEAERR